MPDRDPIMRQGCRSSLAGHFWLFVVFLLLMSIACTPSSQLNEYEQLDIRWRSKALEEITKYDEHDPRQDSDALRPLVSYRGAVIHVNNFLKQNRSFFVGEGWKLTGSVIDVVPIDGGRYVLLGRENTFYRAGLINNIRDEENSFIDYFLVLIALDDIKILAHERLKANVSQVLMGLRRSKNGKGVDVIINSPYGRERILGSYR